MHSITNKSTIMSILTHTSKYAIP